MSVERTLTILKPDCVKKGLIGEVIKRIQEAGFRIIAMKMMQLTPTTAGGFYAVHKERPFYEELCDFMSSGPCVPILDHSLALPIQPKPKRVPFVRTLLIVWGRTSFMALTRLKMGS